MFKESLPAVPGTKETRRFPLIGSRIERRLQHIQLHPHSFGKPFQVFHIGTIADIRHDHVCCPNLEVRLENTGAFSQKLQQSQRVLPS